MAKKTYSIKIREEGRGKANIERFATLVEAALYIEDRWQGADYIDSDTSFHSDYSTYELVGFTLKDIGTFDYSEGFRDYTFKSDAVPADEPTEPNERWHDGADRWM